MIRTERLTLRAPRLDDADSIARHANDQDVSHFLLALPHPYGPEDARTYIGAQPALDKPGQSYVICASGQAVGCIGTVGEFGYWLGQAFWGQGLATEAALAVITRHFDADGRDLASSHAFDNERSGRVLEKCGFRYTGDTSRRVGRSAGQDHVHRMMRLTRADWEAHQGGGA